MSKKGFLKKLLLVVDSHETSIVAAKYAVILARELEGIELHCISVVNTSTLKELMKSGIFVQSESSEYAGELEKNAERYLAYVSELAGKKNISVTKTIKEGSIHGKIIETAKDIGADMIIVAEWPHLSIRRNLLDNEHRIMTEEALIPVLVIPKSEDIEKQYLKL